MRKLFVALAMLLLANNVLADYIRAEGRGNNFIEARNEAFAKAIDFYVGTVVVSEREMHNYNLVKNDILVYSSGYVNDYKVVSQQVVNNQVYLVLDVSVNSNKIANRIIGKFESSNEIDGSKAQGIVDSYLQERKNADRLLQTVLNDYPYKAFNIEQLPSSIATNDYRQLQLVMPYKLSWNYNYLKALGDVTDKIQDAKSTLFKKAYSQFTISVKPPDSTFIGTIMKYEFNDLTYPNRIAGTMYAQEIRIMGRVIDKNNQTVWYICHHPLFLSGQSSTFYGIGDVRNIILYGNSTEKGEVRLDISPKLHSILQDVFRIQLQIVRHTDC